MASILVVDDDEYIRRLYQRIFTTEDGYDVATAVDGDNALTELKAFKPDIILLDIDMPVKDGLVTLKEIKGQTDLQKIPVVMLTNLASDEKIKQAFSLGAEGYLLKASLDPEQVKREVNNFLNPPSNQPSQP